MTLKLNLRLIAAIVGSGLLCLLWIPQFVGHSTKAVVQEEGQVALPVIMYHQMLKNTSRKGAYVITPEQFEDDLKYIEKNGYNTVTIEDILDFAENGAALPEKPILLTFDDGYETAYAYALPLLQQYNMNAVVSVITRYTEEFSAEPQPHHLSYSHLSFDQLSELDCGGFFEIGNHTYNMHGDRSAARFGVRRKWNESEENYIKALEEDIGKADKLLREALGHEIDVFAYPFGVMTEQSGKLVTELGYKIILSCEEKINYLSPFCDTPIVLDRFNRSGDYSTTEFFKKLQAKD